jgi:glycosyltransferase involved in cell wall biosynthesis
MGIGQATTAPIASKRRPTTNVAGVSALLRKVRVLHVSSAESRGGNEEGVLSLLRNFDRSKFSPMLACPPALIRAYGKDLEGLDINVYPLPALSRPYQFGAIRRLTHILRTVKPDVVHTHLFVTSLCAAPVARLCGVPVVIESCRIREAWRRGLFKSYWIDRYVNRFVDANIAISESLRGYLTKIKGFPREKVFVIRNGRELCRVLADSGKDAGELRREFGVPTDHLVICIPGRLEVQKGHHYLLEALPVVLSRFPNVRVLLLGDGSLRDQLQTEIHHRGLQDYVLLTGYRQDVYDIIRISDLVVLPSMFEGLPLVAIEAGALGRPIVATAVDGTPEVVLHEKTGWLVPPANGEELAQAICMFLGDPELRRRCGERARHYILQEYSFERVIKETENLYLDLCMKSKRRLAEGTRACAES